MQVEPDSNTRKSKCCRPDGWTPETEPLADGFGCVTPALECGPFPGQMPQGFIDEEQHQVCTFNERTRTDGR